jgi:transposase-like protein
MMYHFYPLISVIMKNNRKYYTAEFKAKVALATLSGHHTINELSALYELHQTQIGKWKAQLTKGAGELFADRRKKEHESNEKIQENLYKEIGKQKVEIDWLKKKVGLLYSR